MRHLNKASLDIISAVQALRTFAIRDAEVTGNNKNWSKSCREYYDNIPSDLMAEAHLFKNEDDFMLVLDFEVTPEMTRTAFFLLDRFVLDPHDL